MPTCDYQHIHYQQRHRSDLSFASSPKCCHGANLKVVASWEHFCRASCPGFARLLCSHKSAASPFSLLRWRLEMSDLRERRWGVEAHTAPKDCGLSSHTLLYEVSELLASRGLCLQKPVNWKRSYKVNNEKTRVALSFSLALFFLYLSSIFSFKWTLLGTRVTAPSAKWMTSFADLLSV